MQYFRESRDGIRDHENIVHELFVGAYSIMCAVAKIIFPKFSFLVGQFCAIHEIFVP